MTTDNRIIPQNVNTGLEIDYTALQTSIIGGDIIPVLDRAERTPGVAAVSGLYGRESAEGNISAGYPKTNSKNTPDQLSYQYSCGTLIIFTECEPGDHHFAKKILCGKEWCDVCGEDDSQAHNRKIARWLPKFQQISQLGYFVVEFPDKYRKLHSYAYSKRALRAVTTRIVDTMAGKRMGRRGRVGGFFSRGLVRWHWFGDKKAGKWNPHANIAVDGAYIEDLQPIKDALREALNCPDLIVHYSYFDQPGEIYHKLKYITRATFKNYDWDPYMAHQLYGFRNARWWGSWKDQPAWVVNKDIEAQAMELQAISKLGSGYCPDCGAPLKKWSKPVDSAHLVLWGAEEIGNAGYYRIPKQEFNSGELSPGAILRLEELERSAKDKPPVDSKIKAARRALNRHLEGCSTFGVWDDYDEVV